MLILNMGLDQIKQETVRIIKFISDNLCKDEKAVIGLSGGLDSDVVTRMTVEALGKQRVKLFTVIQSEMEPRHLENARRLAIEMDIQLIEIKLESFPFDFIRSMQNADPSEMFNPKGLLDPSRAKCSMRTVIISTYQDRGYIIIGTSNRTELETGFFLPFGDALAHIKPIAHLYKTQVRQIAETLGTCDIVLQQPASAGFWEGQEDIEDLSYWLYHKAPIRQEISFDTIAESKIKEIRSGLSTEKIDLGLLGLSYGMKDEIIAKESGLSVEIVSRLRSVTLAAKQFKLRPIGVCLENI